MLAVSSDLAFGPTPRAHARPYLAHAEDHELARRLKASLRDRLDEEIERLSLRRGFGWRGPRAIGRDSVALAPLDRGRTGTRGGSPNGLLLEIGRRDRLPVEHQQEDW